MTTTMTAPDLLAAIVAAARRIVEVRREREPESALERRAAVRQPNGVAFVRALRESPLPRVIAECKRRSPSKGILRDRYDPAEHAKSYEAAGAAAISVLTEPTFFDGSLDHLQAVRSAVRVPLLRKDFVVSRYQILEAVAAGADAVLLIVGALTDEELTTRLKESAAAGVAGLVEVHDRRELDRALHADAKVIGVNSRNLRTLDVDSHVHRELIAAIPKDIITVAESGLREAADLQQLEEAGYSAFLVGERLISQPDPGAALRALRGERT
jgi:indole-3-glycerol phosphate synthase